MTAQSSETPLAGLNVWLTRPRHQAHDWAAGLERAGARVAIEPLLEIAAPADEADAQAALADAEDADIVIATSGNAVHHAWRLRPQFAPGGMLCAVGRATQQALAQAAGRSVEAPDKGDTSEAVLSIPALSAPAGRRIVLLSGEGGRTALVDNLSARGASVRKAALYRRQPAAIGCDRLRDLITGTEAIVITSAQAMNNLCNLRRSCADRQLCDTLARKRVVVPSPRVVQLTPEELFERPPRVVERMTVDAVVAALAPDQGGAR